MRFNNLSTFEPSGRHLGASWSCLVAFWIRLEASLRARKPSSKKRGAMINPIQRLSKLMLNDFRSKTKRRKEEEDPRPPKAAKLIPNEPRRLRTRGRVFWQNRQCGQQQPGTRGLGRVLYITSVGSHIFSRIITMTTSASTTGIAITTTATTSDVETKCIIE